MPWSSYGGEYVPPDGHPPFVHRGYRNFVCLKMEYTLKNSLIKSNRENDDSPVNLGVPYLQTYPYPNITRMVGPPCIPCTLTMARQYGTSPALCEAPTRILLQRTLLPARVPSDGLRPAGHG